MQLDYVISVITPVYNAEDFLEETIDSVLDQSIGFKDNIQLILVNDGSPDDSGDICQRYRSQYPDNIVYIEKENGGVSSARNCGLKYIKGKYTIFLDADDIWEKNAFKNIARFFDDHYDEIDVCACRLQYLGRYSKRKHPLDYRFEDGNRVVDLEECPDYVCVTIGSAAFKSACVLGREFDETMRYGEDSWFMNQCIAEKLKVGIIGNAEFLYRKESAGSNASVGITRTDAWYFDVPVNYYFKMLDFAKIKYQEVPAYFQQAVFYDIKWRGNNPYVVNTFSDQKKQAHLDLIRQSLVQIDDSVILGAENISVYKKLYFLNIKHGTEFQNEAVLKGHKLYYQREPILNLRTGSLLEIRTMEVGNHHMTIEGISRMDCLRRTYTIYASSTANSQKPIPVESTPYPTRNFKGLIGEDYICTERFKVTIPISEGCRVLFFVIVDGQSTRLRPRFNPQTGLRKGYKNSYCVKGRYLLKLKKGVISFYRNQLKTRVACEYRLRKEMRDMHDKEEADKRIKERASIARCSRLSLKKRVAFISIRSDELSENMKRVYDQLDLPKIWYAKKDLGNRSECIPEARKILSSSKIVVTDDYLFLMKEKKPGQRYIQLWHATGAGKRFGLDGTVKFPAEDAQYHQHYDLVTVSSENIRNIYATAFGISADKVKATGVARTDDFFNREYIEKARQKVFLQHPELKDKKILLYTPTFRDIPGLGRSVFKPQLDFDELSEVLLPDQIFVVRPHPVMAATIVNGSYDNIVEIRDLSSNELMFVSDLLLSDYSSTMFEYSLLRKPMAFFCYDFEEYDRDFYMDFERELPGPLLKTQEELFNYIRQEEHPLLQHFEDFHEKYMSACDGHSTERIVAEIKKMMND